MKGKKPLSVSSHTVYSCVEREFYYVDKLGVLHSIRGEVERRRNCGVLTCKLDPVGIGI